MPILSDYWDRFQVCLFPHLEVVLEEPLTEKLKQLVRILDVVSIHKYVVSPFAQWMGRKKADRRSIARAFLAKAVYDLPTTEMLLETLRLQPRLRRLCGFEYQRDIPSASTFSRAFAEFAEAGLGERVHEALVKEHVGDKIVMHVSRDSTEVVAREKPVKKVKPVEKPKQKRGRPKKGETVAPWSPNGWSSNSIRPPKRRSPSCRASATSAPKRTPRGMGYRSALCGRQTIAIRSDVL